MLHIHIPAIYLLYIADAVRSRGRDAGMLFAACGLVESDLQAEGTKASVEDYVNLCMHAMRITGDECLGCDVGFRIPATVHGVLGWAAFSRATLRDALNMGVKFFELAQPLIQLLPEFRPSPDGVGEDCTLTFNETIVLGPVRQFVMESTVIAFLQVAGGLLSMSLSRAPIHVHFPWPESPAFARYHAKFAQVSFNAPALTIDTPASLLNTPLPMHEPRASKSLEEACLQALQTFNQQDGVVFRTLACLKPGPEGYPSRETVANTLGLSERTMLRQLAAHNTTFHDLLQVSQQLEAQTLLRDPQLDIESIGLRLGYQDPANFSRAFKRWTQLSPTEWRAQEIRKIAAC